MSTKLKLKLNTKCSQPVNVEKPITISQNILFENEIKPYRAKVIEILKTKTQLHSDKVSQLEHEIYLKTVKTSDHPHRCARDFDLFNTLYRSNANHLINNLKLSNEINNKTFIDNVNQGVISPEIAVNLAPEEMHKERWSALEEKKLHYMDKSMKPTEATSDLFFCGRCKRNKTTYYSEQTRSSDEPMTVFITCVCCGHKWKQ